MEGLEEREGGRERDRQTHAATPGSLASILRSDRYRNIEGIRGYCTYFSLEPLVEPWRLATRKTETG